MKKYLLCGAAVFTLVPAAHAETSVVFKPYVGVDLQRLTFDYQDGGDEFYEENLNGLNIHAGFRINKHFGVEAGVFKTQEESKSIDGAPFGLPDFSTNLDLWGVTLDGMGYLPIHEKFELIGTAGVSWINGESSIDVDGTNLSLEEQEFGFRLGAGGQFNVTEQWNVRGLARYQSADFDDSANNAVVYTLGLNYNF